MTQGLRTFAFFALSIALFVAIDLAAAVAARVSIEGLPAADAAIGHLQVMGTQLVGTVFLALPFLGLAAIGLPLLRTRGWADAGAFLCAFALVLAAVYGLGYRQSSLAMLEQHWTAAALSQAAMALYALPVLLVAWTVRLSLARRKLASRPGA